MSFKQTKNGQKEPQRVSELLQHILHDYEAEADVHCLYEGGMPFGYRPSYAECQLVVMKVAHHHLILIKQRKAVQLSITNGSEQIAICTCQLFSTIDPLSTVWIQHYAGDVAEYDHGLFAEVTYDWKIRKWGNVSRMNIRSGGVYWRYIPQEMEGTLVKIFAIRKKY